MIIHLYLRNYILESKLFTNVKNFVQRISIPEIKKHPWFLKNLPKELIEIDNTNYKEAECEKPSQSVDEIMRIINEAKTPGEGAKAGEQNAAGTSGMDELEGDIESEADASGDYVTAV